MTPPSQNLGVATSYNSRIHSFIQAISIAPLQVHYIYYSEAHSSLHSTDTVSKFHAEAPQATTS